MARGRFHLCEGYALGFKMLSHTGEITRVEGDVVPVGLQKVHQNRITAEGLKELELDIGYLAECCFLEEIGFLPVAVLLPLAREGISL